MEKYRVSGPHAVFGHAPDETFEREIPPEQEARLLASGALKKSQAQKVDAVDRKTNENKEG